MIKVSSKYIRIIGLVLVSSAGLADEPECRQYVDQVLVAIDSCKRAMEDALMSTLPSDVDYVGADVFEGGFELSFSHGRSRRDGGAGGKFRPYVVCAASTCGELRIGNFFAYDDWPSQRGTVPFRRAKSGHFERFYGADDQLSFSHQGKKPIVTLVFSRQDTGFAFLECRSVPDDWW